jgi:hypothetical protein
MRPITPIAIQIAATTSSAGTSGERVAENDDGDRGGSTPTAVAIRLGRSRIDDTPAQ